MVYLLIMAGAILLDQLTKVLTVQYLKPVGSIPIIENVFHLTYAENTGAAFSMLSGQTFLLTLVSIAAVGVFIFLLYSKLLKTSFAKISLAMIAGGAVGNLLDRLFRGFVVDLFDFRLINFAIFNVADSFIVVGGILFIIAFIREERLLKKAEKKDENGISGEGN